MPGTTAHHTALNPSSCRRGCACFRARVPFSPATELTKINRSHAPPPSPQRAITEGSSLSRLSEALKIEAKEFVYRSYIALGQFNIVIDEIADDPSIATSLQAVKLLARYLSQPQDKEMVLMTLNEWLTGPQTGNPSTLQLIAAIIYLHEDNTKDALRCIHLGATMEHLALTTQIYLQMNRPELAQKTVRSMQQADEDATLTQLAIAWTHLATGGAKLQEAAYIFDEVRGNAQI